MTLSPQTESMPDRLRRYKAERDAYRKAKQENDERFQLEAAEQRGRAEQAEAREAALRERIEKATTHASEMDRAGGGIYNANYRAGFRYALSRIAEGGA